MSTKRSVRAQNALDLYELRRRPTAPFKLELRPFEPTDHVCRRDLKIPDFWVEDRNRLIDQAQKAGFNSVIHWQLSLRDD